MANKVYKPAKYIKDDSKNRSEYDFRLCSLASLRPRSTMHSTYTIFIRYHFLGLCRRVKPKIFMTDRESFCRQFAFSLSCFELKMVAIF
jgi:hypothetical protein